MKGNKALKDKLIKKAQEKELDRHDRALVEHVAEKAEHGTRILTDATNGSIGMLHMIHRLAETLKTILDGIPWLMTISLIFTSLIKIVSAVINENQSASTRGVKVLTAVAALGLAIASLVLLPLLPILLTASIAVDVMWAMWDMADSIHTTRGINNLLTEKEALLEKQMQCDQPDLKAIEKTKSEILTLKEKYRKSIFESAEKTQHFALNMISLAGAIIFITVPVLGPILGSVLLIATAGYGIIDKLGWNPLRYLAKKAFDHFFFKEKKETITSKPIAQKTETPEPVIEKTETPTPKPKETPKPVIEKTEEAPSIKRSKSMIFFPPSKVQETEKEKSKMARSYSM